MGEWRRAGRNPALRESAARSGAYDWAQVAMVAAAASTECRCISTVVAEHKGGEWGARGQGQRGARWWARGVQRGFREEKVPRG